MSWPYEKMIIECFTIDECNKIANAMIKLRDEKKLSLEQNEFYRDSLGSYNLKEAVELLPKVAKITGLSKFENTYTRIYKKGSYLRPHTDRNGLDYTLSICVYSDMEWPLCISNIPSIDIWNKEQHPGKFLSNFTEYLTPVGYGILCEGTKFPHWRRELECKDNEMVIQSFFHWQK